MISQDTIALIVTILVAVIGAVLYGGQQIALVNKRIDDLRSEMHAGFGALNTRISDLRSDMTAGFARMHTAIDDLRKTRT